MSLSKPFFNSKPTKYRNRSADGMTDKDFNALHWTRQLELRPLRYRRNDYSQYDTGDSNVRLDMDWDPNISEDKETT